MTKKIFSVLVLFTVLVGGWYFFNYEKYAPTTYVTETSSGNLTTDTTTGLVSTTTPTYSMADVVSHKDAASCYSVISGKVYDLTMWVNLHPGGKRGILAICGNDGTEKFIDQHHGATKQMSVLARYQIGVLTQ